MYEYKVVNPEVRQYSPTTSYTKPKYTEPQYNDGHLPPKTFIGSKESTLKRAIYQSSIGLGILIVWVTIFTLWQWALNARIAKLYNEMFAYYYYGDSDTWKPRLLMSTFDFYQPCDADTYSSLEPTFLLHGNFTLGEVKAMDISFNMVIGRGTQALLLWVSYYATMDILMRLTENTSVRFDLFSALAFNPSSISTTWRVTRSVFTLRGWRGKFIMGWIFISSIFLIILPTLIDTMTGYIQNQRKDVEFYEGENRVTVPFSAFNEAEWRLNHTGTFDYVCTKQEGYQWGLAELWVSITIILFGFWILGTFTIWMDAQHACGLRRKGRGLDTMRAAVDLAGVVDGALGENISAYSGKELRKAMEKNPGVMYGIEVDQRTGMERIKLGTGTRGLGKLDWNTAYG